MTRAILVVSLAGLGCTTVADVCVPGSTQMCLCPDLSSSAQVCAEDGARWELCQCAGVDGGGMSVDSGTSSMDSGPIGPTVTCVPPGSTDIATLISGAAGAADSADLTYFSGGALASIAGSSCTLAADQTGGSVGCFDRYDCGPCTIEISAGEAGERLLYGTCPMYMGSYTLCQLTTTCDGRQCGMDSCGRPCGAGTCPSGQVCTDGRCGTPPCPRGCMQGAVCCGPPFCAGDCVGTPCC